MENIPTNYRTLLVWKDKGLPPKGDWIAILWRGFEESTAPEIISIPRFVEEHADKLRSRYLAWIYEFGETRVDGKRLIDHLELRPGFSYWWMTLLAHKPNSFASPWIVDAVKIMACEELVRKYSPSTIILAGGDQNLARIFRLWCRNAGLAFEWQKLKGRASSVSLMRRLDRLLPHPVQALVSLLRYCLQRWPLRRAGATQFAKSTAKITFCSYFDNLDMVAARQDHFYSRYWTSLPEALAQDGSRSNWLQLYVQDKSVPTARQARDLITRFNQNGAGMQSHITLDGALGWSVILGAICDYGRIVLAGLRLRKARHHFRPVGSNVDLWPLFEQDWRKSLFGAMALSNCMFLNLFERTLKGLPRQELGLYLQENIGWEMAFIHTWKAAGHGRLLGVPHATVRYWDLRYFFDPRSYQRTGKNDLPLPDVVALNGPAAMAAYRRDGFPEDRIVEVEALRYLYLADLPFKQSVAKERLKGPLRILVLGDYLSSITLKQMQWLLDAAPIWPPDTSYIIKPHPNCPLKASDYPALHLQITSAPLAELLGNCDAAYTSNVTSAAVDACCAGVPVVSMLDGDAFNMNPLRGLPGVTYVTGPTELAHALRHATARKEMKPEAYFCLDKKLPRWKSLLRAVSDA